jgi:hydrogenase nickel incorporation protein HypA/HybF
MHELSIALEIVDQITEYFENSKLNKVYEVEIDIGELSGVDKENLSFMLPFAAKGSVIENSVIRYNIIKGRANCLGCHADYDMLEIYDVCPICHNFEKQIIQGKEFRINTILAD